MKMPSVLLLTKEDGLWCWDTEEHYGVVAKVNCDLSQGQLLDIQEWCEEARAWLKERRDNGKAATVVEGKK